MFKDLFTDFVEMGEFLSTHNKLDKIKIPLFGLGSYDDIMFGPETHPSDDVVQNLSSSVCLATSDKGAHCCHMTGTFLPRSWY
jgi:predicted alpha/beta-fold hydrolase